MSTVVTGTYFDGRFARAIPVMVAREGALCRVTGEGLALELPVAALRVSGRLARIPRVLHLPGRARVESLAHPEFDHLFPPAREDRLGALVRWLETRTAVAAAATLLVAGIAAGALFWAVPAAAQRAALAVPVELEREAGRASLAQIERFMPRSQLDRAARARVQARLDDLIAASQLAPVELVFREFGTLPNAFALPGRIIVVTDGLVGLAENDEQLSAVLAHELAHLEARHGLQSVFRQSLALLVVTGVTGDLSTLTGFAAALPITLLQNGYSRAFEREADAQALVFLDAAGIEHEHLARILELLDEAVGGDAYTYLSTHPPTPERLDSIRGAAPAAPAPP